MGGSWVINPPLFPCLNSSSVPQKPHFKHWSRMVPVRAIPRSVLGFTNAYWGHFFSCLTSSGSISTVLTESLLNDLLFAKMISYKMKSYVKY